MLQLVSSILFTFTISASCFSLPSIKVNDGLLVGTYYSAANGKLLNAFLGIPYAAPPVGNNRFKEPQPVEPWVGFWNASSIGSKCMQYYEVGYQIIGDEDCLHLNVYTPKLPSNGNSELLDVIVYIHGGCFMFGTGNAKFPDYLMESNDIVYVTINYRLGPLGFMSFGDEILPGNNGLKDQVAALKWIQKNIAKFGGNPKSVTITGMSAGGASVHYHFLSPLSKGLFQRGISQSGSSLTPWAFAENVTEKSKIVASHVGCSFTDTKKILECLRHRSARQILEQIKEFMPWRYNPFSPFGPVAEPKTTVNAFITEKPMDLLLKGEVQDLPWIVSETDHEGLYPVAEFLLDENMFDQLNEQWNDIAHHLLDYNYTVPQDRLNSVNAFFRNHYFGNKDINKSTYDRLIAITGHRLFDAYLEQTARLQAKVNTAPVYFYQFGYSGKYSLSNVYCKTHEYYGVSHGDDTQYMIRMSMFHGFPNETVSDRHMVKLMVNMWTSYAKTGIPNVDRLNWPPVSKGGKDFDFLRISSPTDLKIETMLYENNKFKLWNDVLQEYPDETYKFHEEL